MIFYLEPAHERYHETLDCPALVAQDNVEIVLTKTRPLVRACSFCVHGLPSPPHSPDGQGGGRDDPAGTNPGD